MIWVELGLDPDAFWRSTPRLMALVVEAKRREAENAHQDRAWLAWTIAALHRAKKMPPLESIVSKKRQQPRRRVAQADRLLTLARMWTAATNGQLRG